MTTPDVPQPPRFLEERNCSAVVTADRATILIDAAEYYRRLEQSLRLARKSILIVGWDFDASISLRPDCSEAVSLGDFLRSLVEQCPDLKINILVWSVGVWHGPGATLPMLVGASWEDHPHIAVRLDTKHPIYGARHEKIVCIDGAIAFTGGIDLTVRRWDMPDHLAQNPRRISPDGKPYPPVHDVQIVVEGEAARAIADIAGRRWKHATGETLAAVSDVPSVWPADLAAHFRNVRVGIACTDPGWDGAVPDHSAAALTLDAISRSRRLLYIEAQYVTSVEVDRQLAISLQSEEGPEIVIVTTQHSSGLVEHFVMGKNRNRLLRRLKRQDKYDRLRVFCPVAPGSDKPCSIAIHSKVIIADDDFLRVGSSNLNNRSMGLDTECDVGIEALDDEARNSISQLRRRLLAEHLGASEFAVAQAVDAEGSMIRAIDRLNVNPRGLRPLRVRWRGETRPLWLSWLLDPVKPLSLRGIIDSWRGGIAPKS